MKLNFWQWLGVVLLIIGLAIYIWDKRRDRSAPPGTTTQQTP